MTEQYNLGPDDLSDLSRWMTQRKAAGIETQPWMVGEILKKKYDALYNQRAQNRSLGVQEGMLGVREGLLAEQIRSGNLNREAARESGMLNLGTSALTTAMMLPYVKDIRKDKLLKGV
jgi:hypothetical protein